MNRPDVLRLFATQHGVAALRQLAELGISRDAASAATRRGSLERVHRGVYAIPGTAPTFAARALSLQLLAGPGAFLSGPTAGHLHGLRGMPTEAIEVTIHEESSATLPAPHRLVTTSWLDEARDVRQRADGIRMASPLRTLFGLARRFNQHRFERAAEDLWHRGLVTPDEADDYLTAIRQSGKHGVKRMEQWLERTSFRQRPSQSGLELAFVEMIARVGLPTPARQLPLTLPSGEIVHLDLAWPDVRLAVEPGHSWWHGGDHRQRADQARDRACALVGWHVHRYDETATRDRAATARELLALYRRRADDLRSRTSDDDLSA
ncbi:MAG TPA: AbiEi antitoxin N-terminal domain-containing protein [Ilumatobacteraceae bacterium]|nr:AbiEi antitoxin N-terminal domain-containing protein [Ilumatobacteraceae bacterium]